MGAARPIAATPARPDPWAPLRHRTFLALWAAQFASNIGTWAHTVGAQWLTGDLGGSPFAIALIQTANSLPVFFLAALAGALGDIVDRRHLLISSESLMGLGAAALAVATFTGATSYAVLIALTLVIGVGKSFSSPVWSAVQPELVDREEIPQAAAINSVSSNLARAVGPAIGGLLVAVAGADAVFALNALTFAVVVWALWSWHRRPDKRMLPPEHVGAATRSGWRYLTHTPAMMTVLLRAAIFIVFGSVLWALIPVVARDSLRLGSSGYGFLLGSIGIGSLIAAFVLPALRARLTSNELIVVGSTTFAAGTLVLGFWHWTPAVFVALMPMGLAWTAVVSSLNGTAQALLPNWVRARGMAYYSMVWMGAQALGAAIWGAVTSATTIEATMALVAVGLVGTALFGLRVPLEREDLDLRTAPFSEPTLVLDPAPESGPVLVSVEYRVPNANADRFEDAMAPVERVRRSTGAERWALYQDGNDPGRFVELFVVPTWEEHVRQSEERLTRNDREIVEQAMALVAEGSEQRVSHFLNA